MQKSLFFCIFCSLLLVSLAAKPTPAQLKVAKGSALYGVSPREAVSKIQIALEDEPDYLPMIIGWLVIGFIFMIMGTVLFLFSEINAVLVVRDQDFRQKLVESEAASVANGYEYRALLDKEKLILAPRPYLTVLGTGLLVIGYACVLFPLCDIFSIAGLPSAPCVLLVTFGAFFGAICIVAFYMFLVWSCTRPFASLVFLLISLSGMAMLPGTNPIMIFLWVVLTLFVYWTYFVYLPTVYTGPEHWWLQNVGSLDVEWDPRRFSRALQDSGNVVSSQAKGASQGLYQATAAAAASPEAKTPERRAQTRYI